MHPLSLLQKGLSLPPHRILSKGTATLLRWARQWRRRRRDCRRVTFHRGTAPPLARLPAPLLAECLAQYDAAALAAVCRNYLDHRFDLLGSGWMQVRHGMACAGVAGHCYPAAPAVRADRDGNWLRDRVGAPNLAEAQRRWRLITLPYEPIDWHLDFKSGYRWPEQCWHQDVRYGHQPGVDIKVPWELARAQHLPQLALAFALASRGQPGFAQPGRYIAELRNQVIDFAACNPPRFGVNWRCPMDVAIRAVNWLVARDLLLAHGAELDDTFERLISTSMVEHGRFIRANLEGAPGARNNHYLADIVGLLFIAAYLPGAPEAAEWLPFAAAELVQQVQDQFLPDGGNFEASTTYHGLSVEMITVAVALLVGLRQAGRLAPAAVPAWLPERLEAMARFSTATELAAGVPAQIGDNDSGCLLKLSPTWEQQPTEATCSRFANLAHAAASLHPGPYFRELPPDVGAHSVALLDLVSHHPASPPGSTTAALVRDLARGQCLASASLQAADPAVFPDFGLFVYEWDSLRLLLRCGPVGQNGVGGHAHNDQLSLVLSVNGKPCLVDPGSYLYTPVPALRNEYRATARHNTLAVPDAEQNAWLPGPAGLFSLRRAGRARVVEAGPALWIGEHDGFGRPHRRSLRLEPDTVTGVDRLDRSGPKLVRFHLAPSARDLRLSADRVHWCVGDRQVCLAAVTPGATWCHERYWFSPAYGWAEPAICLSLQSSGNEIAWRISVRGAD